MKNTILITIQSVLLNCDSPNEFRPPTAVQKGDNRTMPLRLARAGEWVRIVELQGGVGCHDRLAGMGLRIGVQVQILHNPMDGKLVLGHEGTRLFLGGGMAQKIQVVIIKGENQ